MSVIQYRFGVPRRIIHLRLIAACALLLGVWLFYAEPTLAQALGAAPRKSPFGIGGEGAAAPPSNALIAWILAKQSEFYRAINAAIRQTKADGTAVLSLSGLSFLYGVFHAAGPGHGKAIIAAYVVANESALKRGTVIAFLAAALQGSVAVAIIGIIALLLSGTARQMNAVGDYIEIASYAVIAGFGLWLIWRKGRLLYRIWRPGAGPLPVHDADCDHIHMPDVALMSHKLSLRETIATIFAAGARPCTGAILVLVFALSQGIFVAGIAAVIAMSLGTAITTALIAALAVFAKLLALKFASGSSLRAEIAMRSLEFAAAIFVALLGFGLLLGLLSGQGGA